MSLHIPRILLVDDDPLLLQGLCDMLTYRLRPAIVVTHASSDDAAATVRQGAYDVVVCDFKMPRQDGIEVIRQIKSANHDQCIILITGCIEESVDEKAYMEGANAVLRKPLDRDEMVRVIRSLVELSQAASKLEALNQAQEKLFDQVGDVEECEEAGVDGNLK
jgi:CheY-like chemotaxis protein